MSQRRRRMKEKRRRHGRSRPTRGRLAAGAGLTVGATLAAGGATADAATFTVTNTNDALVPPMGSLRAAIIDANLNPNTGGANDEIIFAAGVTGTIDLAGDLPDIPEGVDITGPGPADLSVDGGDASRIFYLDAGASTYDEVNLSGLTITQGLGGVYSGGITNLDGTETTVSDCVITGNAGALSGGGIYNDGALYLKYSIVSGNYGQYGGGIHNTGAFASLYSTISGNHAEPGSDTSGGGLRTYNGLSVLLASTVSGNFAVRGAGIYNKGGGTYAAYSTVSGNQADGFGGGIAHEGTGGILLLLSTISGNNAASTGGGLSIDSAAEGVIVDYTTVAGNTSATSGGGIWTDLGFTPSLYNTLVAGNTDSGGYPDLANTVDADFSLVGNSTGVTINETIAGSNVLDVDPQLGPLANHGGPTMTRALALSSPAVDQGATDVMYPKYNDQRFNPRTFDFPTIANSTATGANGTDIGAFELQESDIPSPPGGGPLTPSNQFSFGKLKLNKKKGTATLTVDVPGPGTLALGGKGVVKQRSGAVRAAISKVVSAAGKVKLLIKSKGKKKRQLNQTGKVKVKAKVTYTPTGGSANSKTRKIKLKKRL